MTQIRTHLSSSRKEPKYQIRWCWVNTSYFTSYRIHKVQVNKQMNGRTTDGQWTDEAHTIIKNSEYDHTFTCYLWKLQRRCPQLQVNGFSSHQWITNDGQWIILKDHQYQIWTTRYCTIKDPNISNLKFVFCHANNMQVKITVTHSNMKMVSSFKILYDGTFKNKKTSTIMMTCKLT